MQNPDLTPFEGMRTVPLYPKPEAPEVLKVEPRTLNKLCKLCPLGLSSATVCMPADVTNEAGQPLAYLLGEYPGQIEQKVGRPFSGSAGQMVRNFVSQAWKGGTAFDYAVRCQIGDAVKASVEQKAVAGCRGYSARVVRVLRPDRIVLLGERAYKVFTGDAIDTGSVRRGYRWVLLPAEGGQPEKLVPAFILMSPNEASANSFKRRNFETDLKWALTVDPKALPFAPQWHSTVHMVSNEAEAQAAYRRMLAAPRVAFDIESGGLQYDPDYELQCVSFTTGGYEPSGELHPKRSFCFDKQALADPKVTAVLKRLLVDKRIAKVGQNVKVDIKGLACSLGVWTQNVVSDTRLKRKLLDTRADADLDTMANLVGMGAHKGENAEHIETALLGVAKALSREKKSGGKQMLIPGTGYDTLVPGLRKRWAQQIREGHNKKAFVYALVPQGVLTRYNARDTHSTMCLDELLDTRLKAAPALLATHERTVRRAIHACARMEHTGLLVDRPKLEALGLYLKLQLEEIEARFKHYEFNPASDDEVREFLVTELKLTLEKLTETGKLSVDAEVLGDLYEKHKKPVLKDLLDWRKLDKQKGTYVDAWLFAIRADGRIHYSLNIDGAETGRMSCVEPNMQNVTRKDSKTQNSVGEMLKDCIIAPPKMVLIQLDFSQLELRLAADISGDPEMKAIFDAGLDYHQRTAELLSQTLWGIPPEQVTDFHRSEVKKVNFGLAYGKTAAGLAAENGWSIEYAESVVAAVLGKFKVFDAWRNKMVAEGRRTGVTWTLWASPELKQYNYRARMRNMVDIASPAKEVRSTAERGCYNTPIQGTGSDYCLNSIVQIQEWLENEGIDARLCLTVHDSIMLECAEDIAADVAAHCKWIMESHPTLIGVPIVADVEMGKSWGSLKKQKGMKARRWGTLGPINATVQGIAATPPTLH